MIDPEILSQISALYESDPLPWYSEYEPSPGIEAISWLFPYETELNMLDLEARDEMMITLRMQAEEIISDAPYVVYKGGDFMWVHSELSISDRIVLLDSNDMFDIQKFESTRGNNHPISNEELIASLQSIHSQFGIEIVGAVDRAVEFNILSEVEHKEADGLSRQIIRICPDVLDDFRGFSANRVVLAWD